MSLGLEFLTLLGAEERYRRITAWGGESNRATTTPVDPINSNDGRQRDDVDNDGDDSNDADAAAEEAIWLRWEREQGPLRECNRKCNDAYERYQRKGREPPMP